MIYKTTQSPTGRRTPGLRRLPAHRDIAPLRRSSRLAAMQARAAQTTTAPFGEQINNGAESIDSPSQTLLSHKTFTETVARNKPHSGMSHTMLPLDGNSDYSTKYSHQSRDSISLPNFERNQKQRLKLPLSSDSIWKIYDNDLKIALPKIFPKSFINNEKNSISEIMTKFDDWIYNFFKDQCGLYEKRAEKSSLLNVQTKDCFVLEHGKKNAKQLSKL